MEPNKNIISILILISILTCGFYKGDGSKKSNKILTNDYYNSIAVNAIKMYISNNGDGSFNPYTGGWGLIWPGGENATIGAVFEDGLLWAGIIGSDTVCGGSTYFHGLQAGKILPDGTADDPSLPKYRVYKVFRGWENLPPGPIRDQYERDYNEWPAEDGAPFVDVNHDSIYTPGIDSPYVGDETMWCVSNDLDSSRTEHLYGSSPIGLEIQTTVYAINDNGFLGNTVFKKYKIINKGQNTIHDMYLSYWEDDDLGDANDDFIGCDSSLNLGYTYNSRDSDYVYGSPPPAVGHMIVQGPIVSGNPFDSAYFGNRWRYGFKNLRMTAFGPNFKNIVIWSHDPPLGVHEGTIESYNLIRGLLNNGDSLINPWTNQPTVFALNGDPALGTGWYEGPGWPGGPHTGDRRNYISSGLLTIVPGDTQEVVVAIFLAEGINNLNSVTALKERAVEIQNYYGAYGNLTDVKNHDEKIPGNYRLFQNYPNPFNPVTKIQYTIGSRQFVSLNVYDILGRKVATLVNEEKKPGTYEITFEGRNLSSGIYFYRIHAAPIGRQAGDFIQTKKMILLK